MKILAIILISSTLFISSCSKKGNTLVEEKNPLANFSFSNTDAKEGTAIILKNESENGVAYHWDFGNGKTSNKKEPNFIYSIHGNYMITMTATNANGLSQRISKELVVNCIFRNPNAPTNPTHAPLF